LDLPSDTVFYNKPPKEYKNLQPFGQIGFVMDKTIWIEQLLVLCVMQMSQVRKVRC